MIPSSVARFVAKRLPLAAVLTIPALLVVSRLDGVAGRLQVATASSHTPPAATRHPALPDTSASACATCHPDVAKGAVVHGPVAVGECGACHVFHGAGDQTTVRLAADATADATQPLCTSCHEDIQGRLKAGHVHAPVAAGDCLTCHDAHAAAGPFLLVSAMPALCESCHQDIREDLQRRVTHAPASADCNACHDPHGSDQSMHLRAAINPLCLACHAADKMDEVPERGAAEVPTLFDRPVARAFLPQLTPDTRIWLDSVSGRGHPTIGHPVTGPADPIQPRRPFTCISCHLPHGADLSALRRFGGGRPSAFCIVCHK